MGTTPMELRTVMATTPMVRTRKQAPLHNITLNSLSFVNAAMISGNLRQKRAIHLDVKRTMFHQSIRNDSQRLQQPIGKPRPLPVVSVVLMALQPPLVSAVHYSTFHLRTISCKHFVNLDSRTFKMKVQCLLSFLKNLGFVSGPFTAITLCPVFSRSM